MSAAASPSTRAGGMPLSLCFGEDLRMAPASGGLINQPRGLQPGGARTGQKPLCAGRRGSLWCTAEARLGLSLATAAKLLCVQALTEPIYVSALRALLAGPRRRRGGATPRPRRTWYLYNLYIALPLTPLSLTNPQRQRDFGQSGRLVTGAAWKRASSAAVAQCSSPSSRSSAISSRPTWSGLGGVGVSVGSRVRVGVASKQAEGWRWHEGCRRWVRGFPSRPPPAPPP